MRIPHRFNLKEASSCINKEVNVFNRKLQKIMLFNHKEVIYMSSNRKHFTKHRQYEASIYPWITDCVQTVLMFGLFFNSSQCYRMSTLPIFLKFLSPTNAPLYYTYKMLKYTVEISHDCSYMFRSIWTIIREPMPNLAKVTILWRYFTCSCSTNMAH
jgi:hypothetical protein